MFYDYLDEINIKEALINSRKPVIVSVARQSRTMESVGWRLPRHFVPRNDELIRGSLERWLNSIFI